MIGARCWEVPTALRILDNNTKPAILNDRYCRSGLIVMPGDCFLIENTRELKTDFHDPIRNPVKRLIFLAFKDSMLTL